MRSHRGCLIMRHEKRAGLKVNDDDDCPKCGMEQAGLTHQQIVSENITVWHCFSGIIASAKNKRDKRP